MSAFSLGKRIFTGNTMSAGRNGAWIEIRGLEALFAKLEKVVPNAMRVSKDILTEAATKVYNESQELVPVDTGALKMSGIILDAAEFADGSITAGVTYGGPALAALVGEGNDDYAIKIHEDLSIPHDDGEAKYLERPFLAQEQQILDSLRKAIAEAIV